MITIKGKDKGDLAPKKRKIEYKSNKEQGLVNQIHRANSTDLTGQAFTDNKINKVEGVGLKKAVAPDYTVESKDKEIAKLSKGSKKIEIGKAK